MLLIFVIHLQGCVLDNRPTQLAWKSQVDYVMGEVQKEYPDAVLARILIDPEDASSLLGPYTVSMWFITASLSQRYIAVQYDQRSIRATWRVDKDVAGVRELDILTPQERQRRAGIAPIIYVSPADAVQKTVVAAKQQLSTFSGQLSVSLSLYTDRRTLERWNSPAVWRVWYVVGSHSIEVWVDAQNGAVLRTGTLDETFSP